MRSSVYQAYLNESEAVYTVRQMNSLGGQRSERGAMAGSCFWDVRRTGPRSALYFTHVVPVWRVPKGSRCSPVCPYLEIYFALETLKSPPLQCHTARGEKYWAGAPGSAYILHGDLLADRQTDASLSLWPTWPARIRRLRRAGPRLWPHKDLVSWPTCLKTNLPIIFSCGTESTWLDSWALVSPNL